MISITLSLSTKDTEAVIDALDLIQDHYWVDTMGRSDSEFKRMDIIIEYIKKSLREQS